MPTTEYVKLLLVTSKRKLDVGDRLTVAFMHGTGEFERRLILEPIARAAARREGRLRKEFQFASECGH